MATKRAISNNQFKVMRQIVGWGGEAPTHTFHGSRRWLALEPLKRNALIKMRLGKEGWLTRWKSTDEN